MRGSRLEAPARNAGERLSMRVWIRDRSLGLVFFTIFFVSWIGQLVFEWLDFVNPQADHGKTAAF